MIYYLFIAIIILLLGYFEILVNSKRASRICTIIITVILVLFSGLKTAGSTDYHGYSMIFDKVSHFDIESLVEPGFSALICLSKLISNEFLFFYFCIALISISLKARAIYAICPYVCAAFFIYFCGCFFERDNDGIRQGLAIGVCFFSLCYLIKKNYFGYILLLIIATTIHYSSAIFILAFFALKIKCKDKYVIYAIFGALLIGTIGSVFTNFVISNIGLISVSSKLEYYSENAKYSSSVGLSIGNLFRIGILLIFIFLRKRMTIGTDIYYLLRNGFAFAIILSLLFSDFIILSHRLPYVFREFQIFIVPYLITSLRSKTGKAVGLTLVFAYCCIILSRFFLEDSVYNHYENILFN